MDGGAWQVIVHGDAKSRTWLSDFTHSLMIILDTIRGYGAAAAAAAAKSLQSCLTLSDPMDCSLPGSSIHGIFLARVLEWGAIAFSNAWKWKVKVKWSHIIKRLLLLGRKAMANLHSVLKSRDITLSRNVCTVSFFFLMVFPVVMYGCESWAINKTEDRIIDAFKVWCWRRRESFGLQDNQVSHSKGN